MSQSSLTIKLLIAAIFLAVLTLVGMVFFWITVKEYSESSYQPIPRFETTQEGALDVEKMWQSGGVK